MSSGVIAHVRSNVVGYIALVFALSGSAYAASSLPNNSVGTKQLKNAAVTNSKLSARSVAGSDVKNGTLTGQQINSSSLGTVPKASDADNLGGSPASAFQALVSGNCTGMGAISKINPDGTVSCQPTGSGVSSVSTQSGSGLTSSNSSGNVTLGTDQSVLQHRIGNGGGCSSGQAIQSVDQTGNPTCPTVVNSVTAAGTGLATSGSSGSVTLTSHPVTQVFGGSIGTLSGTGNQFLAPSGLSTPSTSESAVTEGTSATATTAGELSAAVATAPGTGNSWTVDFDVNGTASTSMTCTISGSTATSCSDTTHTASIPAGSTVDVLFIPLGSPPATRATFGWTATS